MSVVTKKMYTVVFIDEDVNVTDDQSIVATYHRVSRHGDVEVIQDILVNSDLASKIKEHNEKRVEMNRETPNGNEVALKPIKVGDLTQIVTELAPNK